MAVETGSFPLPHGGTLHVDVVSMPAHWASALINGDLSGLDEHETAVCSVAVERLAVDGWSVVCDDGEPYIGQWEGRQTELLDYVVTKHEA